LFYHPTLHNLIFLSDFLLPLNLPIWQYKIKTGLNFNQNLNFLKQHIQSHQNTFKLFDLQMSYFFKYVLFLDEVFFTVNSNRWEKAPSFYLLEDFLAILALQCI